MFISVLALFFYFQTKINSVRQQLCSVQGILTSASDTYVETTAQFKSALPIDRWMSGWVCR